MPRNSSCRWFTQELRRLAAQRVSLEKPGQTLQATALVHEAYLRLIGGDVPTRWDGRGHFFAAAAEAMRRILIDQARRKKSEKAGGQLQRVDLDDDRLFAPADDPDPDELLALDAALEQFEIEDPLKARLVKLRYFAGLSIPDAAAALGISPGDRQAALGLRPFLAVWEGAKIDAMADTKSVSRLGRGLRID